MAYLGLSARGGWTAVRHFAAAAFVLWLALPLSAQSGGLTDAVRNALKACQDAYTACAKGCAGPVCTACEVIRDQCKAEAFTTVTPTVPRTPSGWSMSGMTPVFLPFIPWILRRPPIEEGRGQTEDYCHPEQYNMILARYRGQNPGRPSSDSLLASIEAEQGDLPSRFGDLQATVDDEDAKKSERKTAEHDLKKAKDLESVLAGAKKLVEQINMMSLAGAASRRDSTLIAVQETIARIQKEGLHDRGSVAKGSVGANGSDADVIDSRTTSYSDKQDALARILTEYGKGKDVPLDDLLTMSEKTGTETLIAQCRAEPLDPPSSRAGGKSAHGMESGINECQGESFDAATECCTESGIGKRDDRNAITIQFCPPSRRSPKPESEYAPKRNGCGTSWTVFITGDMPDNPLFVLVPTGRMIRIPYTMQWVPEMKRVYYGPPFLPACDFHDTCWGTCNTPKTGTSQQACDVEFGERMDQICKASLKGVKRAACRLLAKGYQKAVSTNAFFAYDSAQAGACDCCEGV